MNIKVTTVFICSLCLYWGYLILSFLTHYHRAETGKHPPIEASYLAWSIMSHTLAGSFPLTLIGVVVGLKWALSIGAADNIFHDRLTNKRTAKKSNNVTNK